MNKQIVWMHTVRFVVAGCLLAGVATRVGAAQYSGQQTQQSNPLGTSTHPRPGLADDDTSTAVKERMEAQQLRAANDERHKKLVADTDKLLALATELKREVESSKKDELNVVVVRKAGEMEKLAHDVKQRMTY